MKDVLKDVSVEKATKKTDGMNSILSLVFHVNYYIKGVYDFLTEGKLEIRDKFAFDHPQVDSEAEWKAFLETVWSDAEKFTKLLEEFPEDKLNDVFIDEKYGTYYRNFLGIIEHTHYHLGQMVIIKKII